ncbi:CRPV-295 [Crowpox virus]|nr:CRPV-295 [Crowpox virus]
MFLLQMQISNNLDAIVFVQIILSVIYNRMIIGNVYNK